MLLKQIRFKKLMEGDFCFYGLKNNTVSMSMTPKANYKFNVIANKIPIGFSVEIEKWIPIIHSEFQATLNGQNHLEKGKQS